MPVRELRTSGDIAGDVNLSQWKNSISQTSIYRRLEFYYVGLAELYYQKLLNEKTSKTLFPDLSLSIWEQLKNW